MKKILVLLFLCSCSNLPLEERPHWVSAIRSGEESLKVNYGQKTYYRRIAGSPDQSKEVSCNLVVMKAEEDLKKEYPLLPKIPYAVEVLYYDSQFRDCAVTISVSQKLPMDYAELALSHSETMNRKIALDSKDFVTEDEAGEIVQLRSELAIKFAISGLTKKEFEKFAQDSVALIEEANLCTRPFKTNSYSIHGTTHVCWKGDVVAGYCTLKDRQCWTRTP